jgi:hypothetical protein
MPQLSDKPAQIAPADAPLAQSDEPPHPSPAGNSSQADAEAAGCAATDVCQIAPPAAAPSAAPTAVSEDECVICFAELDGSSERRRLECGHYFHASCVGEWIAKDGRCPICRHVVDEAVANRALARPSMGLPPGVGVGLDNFGLPGMLAGGASSLVADSVLLQLSRRLMVFATMEAALSVLVMSYIPDLLSPALMLLSACVTFYGANQFSLRAVAICRPVLGLKCVGGASNPARRRHLLSLALPRAASYTTCTSSRASSMSMKVGSPPPPPAAPHRSPCPLLPLLPARAPHVRPAVRQARRSSTTTTRPRGRCCSRSAASW